jgi:hypothetical protein
VRACCGGAIPDEMTMGRSGGLDAGPIKKYFISRGCLPYTRQ